MFIKLQLEHCMKIVDHRSFSRSIFIPQHLAVFVQKTHNKLNKTQNLVGWVFLNLGFLNPGFYRPHWNLTQ